MPKITGLSQPLAMLGQGLLALVTQFDAMAHTTGAACLLH